MGRINVISSIFAGLRSQQFHKVCTFDLNQVCEFKYVAVRPNEMHLQETMRATSGAFPTPPARRAPQTFRTPADISDIAIRNKLTWLVLGGDPAARSHRVEQFTAL